ncbi:MAG: carbohydrate binding family 9 domain-containing protein [Acidobacteria bacterium]|nr:carbohydrate binding family 9 domain-containing protein [Acidobacteriota bacterium]
MATKPARLLALLLGSVAAVSAQPQNAIKPVSTKAADAIIPVVAKTASIPRIDKAPLLESFLGMKPDAEWEGKLTKLDTFIQANPKDGTPASFRTEVYLGYDDKNFYVIFICFDSEPGKIRARMTRRENIYDDDLVQIMLDTFHDQRRAYSFVVNPLGIQLDRLYSETSGFDDSFDTLWDSEGKLTPQGYVTRMAIPFRSLRFPTNVKEWGVVLQRIIPRLNETSYWPRVSSKIDGRLNQEATLNGFEKISPGRNIQLIPYGQFRTFRALDQRDPSAPSFHGKRDEFVGGLDAKFVVKDRLVLDFTVHPDFSQVESDEPQVTVNQRFEVFFPEKRPFFLENSNFFETPISLVFTRRIADPLFGARATGKLGKYAVGMFFADDRSPGRSVPPSDPLYKKKAYFGILRVNRDFGKNNTVGMIYTERRFQNSFNRVGGLDFTFKVAKNWRGEGQVITSSTRETDGSTFAGPAYHFWGGYFGRKLSFNSMYQDNSQGFVTHTGFFRRQGIRRFSNSFHYGFRPEGKRLVTHGFNLFQLNLWDHNGLPLEATLNGNYFFSFQRQTTFGAFANTGYERLRPFDFSTLAATQRFPSGHYGFFFYTAFFKQVAMNGEINWGRTTNYNPVSGPPVSARDHSAFIRLTLYPIQQLTIDNRYILSRLRAVDADESIFNNHIIRSKWNYQLTRALSLRFITEYNTTLANGARTSITTTKNMNYDFLITYLLHPGTALYVGYNSNLQNLDPSLTVLPDGSLARTRHPFTNDGRQFFVKMSYLFRF